MLKSYCRIHTNAGKHIMLYKLLKLTIIERNKKTEGKLL